MCHLVILALPGFLLAGGAGRDGEGTCHVVAASTARAAPRFPIVLRDPPPAGRHQTIARALVRGSAWLARFPRKDLRFDAAVILSQIRRTIDTADLRVAFAAARSVADHDHDHPQRRFWIPAFASPQAATAVWGPSTDGTRVNPDRVVDEALHCDRNGWRETTTSYVCGPMRDEGGYHSTHALWALTQARERGCLREADVAACVTSLQDEIARNLSRDFEPSDTLAVDLQAERLLMLSLSDDREHEPAINEGERRLLELQRPDGGWGEIHPGEPTYYRYHATGLVVWLLSERLRHNALADP